MKRNECRKVVADDCSASRALLCKPVLLLVAAWVALGMTACMKGELPVPRHEAGNVVTATIDMDPTYKNQIYYSLKSGKVVGQNLKTIWDLGFESSPTGWRIALNTSKAMFAINSGKTDFAAVTAADTTGFAQNKRWDSPTGSPDSTAIGDWRTNKEVYCIDLGYNEQGQPIGFAKVQMLACDSAGFTVRFATLNGTNDTTLHIVKDTAYNMVFLSVASKSTVTIEPPKTDWDIVFSQYTHVFYNESPPTPYLVTGCLLNRYNTTATIDTTTPFDQITLAHVPKQQLPPHINTIGYDWKTFNGTTYTVNTQASYLIRDARNLWYKLHFTGFYNSKGQKGSPQWEYQRL
jgi:hypothetical protein